MGRKKRKKVKNPFLLTALVFSYINPVKQTGFDYSKCKWYQEGKVVFSTNDRVVAYKEGYRVAYEVKVYRFCNVKPSSYAQQRLYNYLKNNPDKYPGWLHHVNYYLQLNKELHKQTIYG